MIGRILGWLMFWRRRDKGFDMAQVCEQSISFATRRVARRYCKMRNEESVYVKWTPVVHWPSDAGRHWHVVAQMVKMPGKVRLAERPRVG